MTVKTEKYRALGITNVPLGQAEVLAHNLITDRSARLLNTSAHHLQEFRTFRTVDDVVNGETSEQTRAEIEELIDKGLLMSRAELLQRLSVPSETTTASISSLGVPTRNRPAFLKNCLESYARLANESGRPLRLVVMDGSDDPASAEANLKNARAVKKEFGVEILYLNQESVETFALQLARTADLPQEIVDFALLNIERCPIDTGMRRNALLLSTVGEMTVQVDDDTVCSVAPSPSFISGLKLSSQDLPAEMWFPSHDEDFPKIDAEADFFKLHEEVLGRSVTDLVKRNPTVDLDQVAPSFIERIHQNGGSILVSSIGMAGDCGTGSPFYTFLRLTGENRQRLTRTQEVYQRAMDTHQLTRCVNQTTICDLAQASGINLGLDNRKFLPPFTPVQRAQDTNFCSFLFSACEGYIAHLPWALVHIRPSRFQYDMRKSATQLFCGKIMNMLQTQFSPMKYRSAQQNLFLLGQYLEDLGTMPLSNFEEIVRLRTFRLALVRIRDLERAQKNFGRQPNYWSQDAQRYIDLTREALANPDFCLAADLVDAFGREHARTLMQRLVLRTGRLLKVWPQMRKAALEIKQQGKQLGIEL
ncbi:MAG TPA: hypothetical protein V6C81_14140 [Planktothrix sp.]|jgi:hypothetical protein